MEWNSYSVGTGENNSQRSLGYGDGIYRSRDGGKNWEHMGLKTSNHIGKIVINPEDSDEIFVAAQGPLWSSGGQRGLFKTSDGGETWEPTAYTLSNGADLETAPYNTGRRRPYNHFFSPTSLPGRRTEKNLRDHPPRQ